jgi:hypothetical protein
MAKKKPTYFYCDSCKGKFIAGSGVTAPKNKRKLQLVCKNCFKQHFGTNSPLPVGASPVLKNQFGGLTTALNNGLSFKPVSRLVGHDGSSLVGHDGSSLMGRGASSLIGLDGSTLIGLDGSTFRRG